MAYYPQLVIDALKTVIHPEKKQDIVALNMVEDDIRINGNRVSFSLLFDRPNDPMVSTIKKMATQAIKTYLGEECEIEGNIFVKIRKKEEPQAEPVLPGVKHVIAVASGKGGVGKSTVTANLAVALAKKGYKVGLLDADIFGPSVPIMFDTVEERPLLSEESTETKQLIEPIEKYGIKMLSIGYFVDPDSAVVWRGSMACNALKQIILQTKWDELDFLLLDMPPGTGDIHITLVQDIPVSGAIVVTTPQDVALADVEKGINLFRNKDVNKKILGIVENMSWFTPAELPNNRYYIFGRGGAQKMAGKYNVPLLGQIPLVQSICECGDVGAPSALDENTSSSISSFNSSLVHDTFRNLAETVVAQI